MCGVIVCFVLIQLVPMCANSRDVNCWLFHDAQTVFNVCCWSSCCTSRLFANICHGICIEIWDFNLTAGYACMVRCGSDRHGSSLKITCCALLRTWVCSVLPVAIVALMALVFCSYHLSVTVMLTILASSVLGAPTQRSSYPMVASTTTSPDSVSLRPMVVKCPNKQMPGPVCLLDDPSPGTYLIV